MKNLTSKEFKSVSTLVGSPLIEGVDVSDNELIIYEINVDLGKRIALVFHHNGFATFVGCDHKGRIIGDFYYKMGSLNATQVDRLLAILSNYVMSQRISDCYWDLQKKLKAFEHPVKNLKEYYNIDVKLEVNGETINKLLGGL